VTSKHGLAVLFACIIAAAVAFGATYPRWHETHPTAAETDLLSASEQNTLPPASASSALPLPSNSAALKWSKLSTGQHLALAPFARDWDRFSDSRKQKWLKIAAQYEKMTPEAQDRLHQRMAEWVRMSPDQRRLARENFQLSKAVPAPQRQKAWAAYQQLPDEQKKKLEASERKNHRPTVVSTPLTGKTEVKDLNTVRHTTEAAKPAAPSIAVPATPVVTPAASGLKVIPSPTAASAPLTHEHP
jgi:hypothetical protein